MKKSDREKVFNMFGRKCAYCGCELQKGWHVDHKVAIRRSYKTIPSHYRHKITKEVFSDMQVGKMPEGKWYMDYDWISAKNVPDGCINPEMECMENYMPACASCNINKHNLSVEEFRTMIAHFMHHLNNSSIQYKLSKRYGLVEETNKPVVFFFETFKK